MKLFKRTSITLSILIVLLWVFMFVWVYYPMCNVRITEVEKEQTRMLLNENNITAPDEFFTRKGKLVDVPYVTYIIQDTDALQKAWDEGKIKKDAEDEYSFDKSYITVVDNIVIIEGKSAIAENVTVDSALSKAKKLIQWLKLSHKDMSAYVYEGTKGVSVTFVPEYKGRRIFDCKISVSLYGGGSYRVQTVPVSLKSTGEKVLIGSSCSALAELAMSDTANGSEIEEMTLGYKTHENKLKPVWEIKTEEDNTYYIN